MSFNLNKYLSTRSDGPRARHGYSFQSSTIYKAHLLALLLPVCCCLKASHPPGWDTPDTLTALQHLDLGSNLLTGTLPPSWGGLVSLVNGHCPVCSASSVDHVSSLWHDGMRRRVDANPSRLNVNPTSCMPAEWGQGPRPAQRLVHVEGMTLLPKKKNK